MSPTQLERKVAPRPGAADDQTPPRTTLGRRRFNVASEPILEAREMRMRPMAARLCGGTTNCLVMFEA